MENENKEILKTEKEEKVTVSVSKPYYDKFKDQISIHSKKHVLAGVVAAVALVTCGGLAAGHFAYKATHPHQDTIEERVVVDPSREKDASITTPVIDEQGNAHTNVSVKESVAESNTKCITGVEVFIGDHKCNSEEYELIPGDEATEMPRSYQVIVKKEALEKHEGKISINPIVEIIKKNISFLVIDPEVEVANGGKVIPVDPQEVEIGKAPHSPTVIGLSEGLQVKGWSKKVGDDWEACDLNEQIVTVDTPLNGTTYKAVLTDTLTYPVNFYLNDGTGTYTTVEVQRHGYVKKPNDPVREGYNFQYWYENDETKSFDFATTKIENEVNLHAKWEKKTFTVTFDSKGGSTVDAQPVKYQEKANKPGNPERYGYEFIDWYKEGTFTNKWDFNNDVVTSDITLHAKWENAEMTLSVSVEDPNQGEITQKPTGKVYYQQLVTVEATAKPGYTFEGWYKEGAKIEGAPSKYSFNLLENTTLTAKFTQDKYTLTLNASPEVGGTVSKTGGPEYVYNQQVTLTASANPGYTFKGWYTEEGTELSTSTSYVYTVKGNACLIAKFTQDVYTLTVDCTPSGGSVTGSGQYVYGETVTLTAKENPGWKFNGWYEDSTLKSESKNYDYTVTKTTTVTAQFVQEKYSVGVTCDPSAGGTASASKTSGLIYGNTIDLTATVNDGYSFAGWWHGTEKVSDQLNVTGYEVKGETLLTAKFTKNIYKVVVSADSSVGGSVTGGGDNFGYQDHTTLTATPNTGYEFAGWYEVGSGTAFSTENPCNYEVTKSANIVGKFAQKTYAITVTAETGGSVVGGGNYTHNQKIKIVATPNAGYKFTGWYVGTEKISDLTTYEYTVTGDATIKATFALEDYTLTLIANPVAGGNVEATQTSSLKYGDTPTLTATENNGYTFDGWYENGSRISTSATYTYTVTKSATITGVFTQNKYTITSSASPEIGGNVTGGGTELIRGATVNLTATPNTGYTFDGWYDGSEQLSTSASYTHTVTKSRNIVGKFIKKTNYEVIAAAETGGTVSGGGSTLSYGDTTILKVESVTEGYTFAGWYNGANKVSDDSIYVYTVADVASVTFTAHFTQNKYKVVCDAAGGTMTGTTSWDVVHGSTIATGPTTITKDGCEFDGWYYDDGTGVMKEFTFGTTQVKGNWTLVARWKAQHIVSFDTNGGSTPVAAQCVSNNGTIATSPNPGTKTGYNFEGWHIDSASGTKFVFADEGGTATTVTSNMILVAKWEDKVKRVEVACDPISGAQGTEVAAPTVTLYDAATGGSQVTDAVGTITYSLDDTGSSTGTTIDSTTGKIKIGTVSGSVKIKATYTPKDGSAATESTEIDVQVSVS